MTELAERLPPEDEHSWPAVLEVEHVVAHTEADVAATGAAFVGVNIEVIDETVRGPAGRWEEDHEERRDRCPPGEGADHYRVS